MIRTTFAAAFTLFLGVANTTLAAETILQFGNSLTRKLTVVATTTEGLKTPRDVKFNPEAPEQLWILNRADDSAVIFMHAGTRSQTFERRKDRYANHFMEEVSSFAFGDRTFKNTMTFATCQESRNTYDNAHQPNDFMGPTLWPADLAIFAKAHQNDQLGGSHIDMNHQSPLCMGIAHQADNKYWVFDGKNKNLVYYDFQKDHDTGRDDHSDCIIRRYNEVGLTRVDGVPGHMIFDSAKKWLYIADTGGKRIIRVDVTTGEFSRRLRATNEPLEEYSEYKNLVQEVFAGTGLTQPSGIAIADSKLFVSDHATGEIIAYDLDTKAEVERISAGAPGIMGITIGPDNLLWVVNGALNTLTRIDP